MVVDITIAVVLMGAMTDGTKMRMADGSKPRFFASCQKIADKADNGAMNWSTILWPSVQLNFMPGSQKSKKLSTRGVR